LFGIILVDEIFFLINVLTLEVTPCARSLSCAAFLRAGFFAAHSTKSPSTKTRKENSGDPTGSLTFTKATQRKILVRRMVPEVSLEMTEVNGINEVYSRALLSLLAF
jgi:hypothetical protein